MNPIAVSSVFASVLPSILPSILAPVSTVVDPLFLSIVPVFLPPIFPPVGAFFAMLAFVGTRHHDGWEQHCPRREYEHLNQRPRPMIVADGSSCFR